MGEEEERELCGDATHRLCMDNLPASRNIRIASKQREGKPELRSKASVLLDRIGAYSQNLRVQPPEDFIALGESDRFELASPCKVPWIEIQYDVLLAPEVA